MPRTFALSIVVALALGRAASAQPQARGDQLVDQLSLQPLRSIANELAALELADPLTPAQYARIIELRRRNPVLVRLGAVADADLAAIAAALCEVTTATCMDATARALQCLADRCEVAFPEPRDTPRTPVCRRALTKRSAPLGVGLDWGTGWHRSRSPHDGRAWSLGIEARLRLNRRFGTVARIDRIAGRDAATDADDDGSDDAWTGSITRITALAGPSIVLGEARFDGEPRFLRIDLLGGYLSTRSQPDESGLAAGVDVALQLSLFRVGARVVQGFGDAADATMVLVHVGFVAGGAPPERDDCDRPHTRRRSSRLALGFEYALPGYGFSSELGLLATGAGIELAWYLTPKLDAVARADLLLFPGYERERTIHQAALAGVRIDHAKRTGDSDKTGFFTTVMGGYTHGAGITPASAGSGAVGDLSVGWGLQSSDAAVHLRLHGRFGIGPDNLDYRALFISGGFELRLDPRRWRGRM